MLIPYKKEYEKIAMGLLSFMPESKDIQAIMEIIELYRSSEPLQLYLWKMDNGRFAGVAGVEKKSDGLYLKDLTVDPSFRNEGLGKKIIEALEERYHTELKSSPDTEEFLLHCRQLR